MDTTSDSRSLSVPRVNYELARAKAIQWLGDRYLLAQPIARRAGDPSRARRHGAEGVLQRSFDYDRPPGLP
jgi:hypothetical protein